MKKNYHIILLCLIVILSFTLNFYAISKYGYGNEYYAAAVLSMTKSVKNFFFVSFDPYSMVSVDKPPFGLWIQALSVILFGYSGQSLILPQALCGSLSCILIYILVNKYFCEASALISSLIFATTPVVVAVSRNNTIDIQLVFVLLLATYFLFKSLEYSKWRYLFLAGFMIGIGFNIKMLQAYMVLPAFCLVYLIFAKEKIYRRFIAGGITIVIMLIVSLSWATIVELTPSSKRPYIDSSSSNSVYELILGHNGMERLFGKDSYNSKNTSNSTPKVNLSNNADINPNNIIQNTSQGDDYIGDASIYRLWISSIYGQISWLLLLSIISILICIKKFKLKDSTLKEASFAFWSLWLLSIGAFFSLAGFYHRYYLCMMAPAISILCGIGIIKIINEFKNQNNWRQFIFPIALILTMLFEIIYVLKYENVPLLLCPLMIIFTIICLIFIIIYYTKQNFMYIKLSLISMMIAILIAPIYWCLTLVIYVPNLTKPAAGPDISLNESQTINATTNGSSNILSPNLGLESYLLKNYKDGSFLVVGYKSSDVAKFIINTGLPCYAYGGFMGLDNTLTLDKLKDYVSQGKITYFLVSDNDMINLDIINYVEENAKFIDESEYSGLFKMNVSEKMSSHSKLYCF